MFVIGSRVKGGLHGPIPDFNELDNGDLKFKIDFRNVYATVLQKWLETPSRPILGGDFQPLPVLG